MASTVVDGDDGLPVEEVGPWVREKHDYLRRYLDASRSARKKFLGPGKAGATFVDLFSAFGRAKIRDTDDFVDGSPVAAWKVAEAGSAPFSGVYVADIDPVRRATCARRLSKLGAPVAELTGAAVEAAAAFRGRVNADGLHFAFLDPHSLGGLDFRIIEELARLPRIDMLIHVSAMDLQRNLPAQLSVDDTAEFDLFAPGWRDNIDKSGSQRDVRGRLLAYWQTKVQALGVRPFAEARPITAERGQRLYWLMLASKSSLAEKLWRSIGRTDRQKELPL